MAITLGETLREVLDPVVQMVNFIKTRPVKSCLFKLFCIDMESQHRQLLLHHEVRWLSSFKVTRSTTITSCILKILYSHHN